MSNSRSNPTLERRYGEKSKALRMSCPPFEQQGGASGRCGALLAPSPDPRGVRRSKIWKGDSRFQGPRKPVSGKHLAVASLDRNGPEFVPPRLVAGVLRRERERLWFRLLRSASR